MKRLFEINSFRLVVEGFMNASFDIWYYVYLYIFLKNMFVIGNILT